jgi:fructose-specific phosphotransferase system component IIB
MSRLTQAIAYLNEADKNVNDSEYVTHHYTNIQVNPALKKARKEFQKLLAHSK